LAKFCSQSFGIAAHQLQSFGPLCLNDNADFISFGCHQQADFSKFLGRKRKFQRTGFAELAMFFDLFCKGGDGQRSLN
jgi:hypothetical protein